MDIVNVEFEKELKLTLNKQEVTLICFKTDEHGNIKFGVNAPRQVAVNRQEIFEMKKSNGNMRGNDERKTK